jgi:hypothetical protein
MREGDSLTRKKAAGPARDEDNVRKRAVSFSDANMVETIRSFGTVDAKEHLEAHLGSTSSETERSFDTITICTSSETELSFDSNIISRTFVVDAAEHLEAHLGSSSSDNFIPGVKEVTQSMQNVVRSAKDYGRIFRCEDGIFEVNQKQLDRVRISKCETMEETGWLWCIARKYSI